jgi:hypothetical protein
MPLYEFERSIEEIELLFPRAKKEVCARRRVVRVTAVGLRSRRAVGRGVELAWGKVRYGWVCVGGLLRKKYCSRKRE